MRAITAFHERLGNLQHDDLRDESCLFCKSSMYRQSGDRLQPVAALVLRRDNTALRGLTPELGRDIQFIHRLNHNAEVMAENLCQSLIDLRCLILAAKALAKL